MADEEKAFKKLVEEVLSNLLISPRFAASVVEAIAADPLLIRIVVDKLDSDALANAMVRHMDTVAFSRNTAYKSSSDVFASVNKQAKVKAIDLAAKNLAKKIADDVRAA